MPLAVQYTDVIVNVNEITKVAFLPSTMLVEIYGCFRSVMSLKSNKVSNCSTPVTRVSPGGCDRTLAINNSRNKT